MPEKTFKNTRERLNYIGEALRTYREPSDTVVMIQIESLPECPESLKPSYRVTVKDGYREASAHAVELYDAFFMARAKLKEAATESQIEIVMEVPTERPLAVPKFKIDPTKLSIPKKS
jgi:hypothetical protein